MGGWVWIGRGMKIARKEKKKHLGEFRGKKDCVLIHCIWVGVLGECEGVGWLVVCGGGVGGWDMSLFVGRLLVVLEKIDGVCH